MANYGLPYMGSKNTIAYKIIDYLPKANNFYDLFCGGCSITHCAMLSRKYQNIYFNDIDGDMPKLFLDSIKGKYKNEKRWISKEDFNKEKGKSAYIRCVWSFGNKGTNYLYGKEIEPYKKAYWYAVMYDDFSLFWALGINIPKVKAKNYKEKRLAIARELKKLKKNSRDQALERLERLQSLQSLEALERLQSLQMFTRSYDEVPIKENSVVYCDIPYENTAEYINNEFNHKKFYDWAYNQKELVVISSYKISDDRFKRVINLKKNSNLQGGFGNIKNEGLFVAKNKIDLWNKMKGEN